MKYENAIEVRDIKKKFKVYYDKGSQLKDKLLFKNRNRYEDRWVLNGISFDVKKGEAIGLVGHNGCGKSTTLKLLTRIMYPNEGTIEMKGRISSLIELGAGFHPDMSGRENIYTNASIFGLTKKEIDARLNDIIEFSEMEEFLDNAVRTYSSGMYMRLAFSVAINVSADILLIDEILAVGDVNFQNKCFNKLREIKRQGTTIVIVSHSLGQIEQICDRTIWLQDGVIKEEGVPREVHPRYLDYMGNKRQVIIDKEKGNRTNDEGLGAIERSTKENELRWGNGDAVIKSVKSYTLEGASREVFATGETLVLKVEYEVIRAIKDARFGFNIERIDGINCYGTNTEIDQLAIFDLNEGGVFEIILRDIQLLPCVYMIGVSIQDKKGNTMDFYNDTHRIEIYSPISDVGLIRINHEWKM